MSPKKENNIIIKANRYPGGGVWRRVWEILIINFVRAIDPRHKLLFHGKFFHLNGLDVLLGAHFLLCVEEKMYLYIFCGYCLPFLCIDGKPGDCSYLSFSFLPLLLSLSLPQVSITLEYHRLDSLTNIMIKELEAISFVATP